LRAVVLPMAHNELTHVEAVAPTCYENGNIEYWYCEACGMAWLDAEGTLNTNLMAVVLPMGHGVITHVEAVAPTCYENGNIEYWFCEACGQAWLDEACTLNTNLRAVVLPMAHGVITHVEAKDATCVENGNIEYWFCEACGQAWLDADCIMNTNLRAVILPATDVHTYDNEYDVDCNVCGAIRVVDCDLVTFSGYSVAEEADKLAFLFETQIAGVAVKEGTDNVADYSNATIVLNGKTYNVKGMGAMVSNNGTVPTSLETNANLINIKAKYLYNLEDASAAYAVRVVGIPAEYQDVEIIAVPYIICEADGVEIVLFDDVQQNSVAALIG
ncbi:MAG: hypothetical protein IJN76_04480, partial [Clostridia bacterium]|nr:hypothetical protein [Clostridia bacterium]